MRGKETAPNTKSESVAPPHQPVELSGGPESLLEQSLAATEVGLAKAALVVPRPIGFHPWEISALINEAVVARHADEAPFLWLLRDRAVTAPHYSLEDLTRLDERVEAHVDGLRVAGEFGWHMSARALEWEEAGEVFAAGVLAMESGKFGRLERVLEVACQSPLLQRGMISAAAWTDFSLVRPLLELWIASENPALRRIAIGAYAAHRRDPGRSLLHMLCDDEAAVRTRASKAAAELGRGDLLPVILHCRADRDPECRFSAARAAARLGDRSGETIRILQEVGVSNSHRQELALTASIRCLPLPNAIAWLRELWRDPGKLRLAVIGTGVAGDPALVGVLMEWMELEPVARVAGEAFSMITGADLKYLDLNQDPPEHAKQGEEDEFEVLTADSDLPFPAPDRIARWWQANRHRFEPGQRYLAGERIEPGTLWKVLVHGKQRQRAAAAVELALLQPSDPMFEVRARGSLQARRLQAWTS